MKDNLKVMIATPSYDGKVHIPYCLSFTETVNHLLMRNIVVHPYLIPGGSLVHAARNKIMSEFLKTDCTHILCVDADLGWESSAVLQMLEADEDIVAGIYPDRRTLSLIFRPVLNDDSTIIQKNGLILAEYVPAGFLLIKREALEKIQKHFPDLEYDVALTDETTETHFAFFDTEITDKMFWGEDYVFCRRANESGIKIWMHPDIEFNHAGVKDNLANHVTSNTEDALSVDAHPYLKKKST